MRARHDSRLAAALLCGVCVVAGCQKPPAAKIVPPPEAVFVSLATLEAAHPLQASLRELDAAAARLQKDAQAPAPVALPEGVRTAFAPLPKIAATGEARNRAARASLLASATETLRRYIAARRATGARILAEKRSELRGIARAESASEEAKARAAIQDETRASIFARAGDELNTGIRRDAADINLTPGNVVSLARDPQTELPSEAVLEAQIATLRANPVDPPPVSDEARLTKLLRDLEAKLAALRAANQKDLAFQDAQIADAIATIRADNDRRVEEQLRNLPGIQNARAEIADARRDVLRVLENVRRTEAASAAGVAATKAVTLSTLPLIEAVAVSPVQTADALRALSVARAKIRATIRRDVTAAVRDAGATRNLAPTLAPAPTLPDRTTDFSQWIFGNVRAETLSNKKTRS